jgi:hypothetical protein
MFGMHLGMHALKNVYEERRLCCISYVASWHFAYNYVEMNIEFHKPRATGIIPHSAPAGLTSYWSIPFVF